MRRTALPALAAALALTPAPALALAAPADKGPALEISKTEGIVEGDKITVNGAGFKPGLKQIAVGLCIEGYTNGLKHCDLEGGAAFVNADDKGKIPELTLTVSTKFLEYDCLIQQCVVGAGPLPGAVPDSIQKANVVTTRLGFEGAAFEAVPTESAAPAAADSDPDGVGGPSAPLWFATAGLLVLVTFFAARRQSLRRIT
ncbi:neocarzinostatin apoprotein domain-containing protein [Actinocorallia sp. B10E7]|uniref:neocarzinostatin apoprotein domain-containing protein n=1 Tax=Actinocorallia sp. B10E7 TaxID=3153558 RepID=UPI00325F11D4